MVCYHTQKIPELKLQRQEDKRMPNLGASYRYI